MNYRNEVIAGLDGAGTDTEREVTESAGYAELDLAYVDASQEVERPASSRATTSGSSGRR